MVINISKFTMLPSYHGYFFAATEFSFARIHSPYRPQNVSSNRIQHVCVSSRSCTNPSALTCARVPAGGPGGGERRPAAAAAQAGLRSASGQTSCQPPERGDAARATAAGRTRRRREPGVCQRHSGQGPAARLQVSTRRRLQRRARGGAGCWTLGRDFGGGLGSSGSV